MRHLRSLTVLLLGTTSLLAAHAAFAADLPPATGTIVQPNTELPAVSGINGKWELDPGILTGTGGLRAAGSVSVPVGERFGLQFDGSAIWNGGLTYSGAMHAFTRDPSKYLAGVTAGFVRAPGATLTAIGPEGELYMDQFSLEGWAGVAGLDYVDPAMVDKTGVFAIGDLAYYATPDWRVALGGSYVLGDTALHFSTEYQLRGLGMPLSLTGDARLHAGGSSSFTVGLKGYFGGSDDGKSLMDRQRQDDPPNRAVDLFTAAGSQLYSTAPGAPVIDSESACITNYGFYNSTTHTGWQNSSGECYVDGEVVFELP